MTDATTRPDDLTAGNRLAALDVARGLAVLGTLGTNVWLFVTPGGPAGLLDGDTPVDGPLATGLLALSNGKFLALLTVLFGVGLAIQHRSALRRGVRWPGRYPLRAAVLFVEGLLHYILIFEYDVLMGYALAALLCADLVGRSPRVQRVWAWSLGSVHTTVLLLVTVAMLAVPAPYDSPDRPGSTDTGSWTAQVVERLQYWPLYRLELLVVVPSAVVLFLVGAALLRNGVFDPTDPAGRRIRRRLLVAGAVAFPANVATAFAGLEWAVVDRYLLPPLVALGILAAVVELVARRRAGVGQRNLTAIGRTALSCYVLQNMLLSVLCFDWGLGLARPVAATGPMIGPLLVVALWAGTSLLLAALATLWSRRFARGPLEALTHAVVRRRTSARS